jgi:hypothetical protein
MSDGTFNESGHRRKQYAVGNNLFTCTFILRYVV